jgi:hypothetical protein
MKYPSMFLAIELDVESNEFYFLWNLAIRNPPSFSFFTFKKKSPTHNSPKIDIIMHRWRLSYILDAKDILLLGFGIY